MNCLVLQGEEVSGGGELGGEVDPLPPSPCSSFPHYSLICSLGSHSGKGGDDGDERSWRLIRRLFEGASQGGECHPGGRWGGEEEDLDTAGAHRVPTPLSAFLPNPVTCSYTWVFPPLPILHNCSSPACCATTFLLHQLLVQRSVWRHHHSSFLFVVGKKTSSALLPRAEPDKSRHTWGRRSGPTQVAARQLIITLLFVYHSFVCLSLLYLFINPLFVYHSFVCLPLLCFWPPKYWRHKKFEPPTAEGDHCCCLQLICCFKQLYCLCDFN